MIDEISFSTIIYKLLLGIRENRKEKEYNGTRMGKCRRTVQEQIDATIENGIDLARSRLPKGESLTHCVEY